MLFRSGSIAHSYVDYRLEDMKTSHRYSDETILVVLVFEQIDHKEA